jgi:hypothetical protein
VNRHSFQVSDSNLGELSARAGEWQSRRLLGIGDELGAVRPGYVKPAWIQPPVHCETPDERTERLARRDEEQMDGDPYPLWIHAVAWLVPIGFAIGAVYSIAQLLKG